MALFTGKDSFEVCKWILENAQKYPARRMLEMVNLAIFEGAQDRVEKLRSIITNSIDQNTNIPRDIYQA